MSVHHRPHRLPREYIARNMGMYVLIVSTAAAVAMRITERHPDRWLYLPIYYLYTPVFWPLLAPLLPTLIWLDHRGVARSTPWRRVLFASVSLVMVGLPTPFLFGNALGIAVALGAAKFGLVYRVDGREGE